MDKFDVRAWEVVLCYMYSGRIKLLSVEDALEYWECANQLRMEKLESMLLGYIKREIDEYNCCTVLATAHRLGSSSLQKSAMKTILRTSSSQCRSSTFIELPNEVVVKILRSDNLMVHSELDMFVAAINWAVCSEVKKVKNSELKSGMFDQVSNLLMHHGLCPGGLVLAEHANREEPEIIALFESVDNDNLSVFDLQLVGRFCRDVCKKVVPPVNSKLMHLQKLNEKFSKHSNRVASSCATWPIRQTLHILA